MPISTRRNGSRPAKGEWVDWLLDSGAGRLLASKEDSTRATNLCTFQAKIGTCSEGESLLTESKRNLDLGINPETTLTPPVVFAKGLAHNVIGTSALDLDHGISNFFHQGDFVQDKWCGDPT